MIKCLLWTVFGYPVIDDILIESIVFKDLKLHTLHHFCRTGGPASR